MPIYEYQCGRCRSEFELLVRAEQVPTCPQCGNQDLEKMLSVPSAPSSSERQLSVAPSGLCGRPECGTGGCQGF